MSYIDNYLSERAQIRESAADVKRTLMVEGLLEGKTGNVAARDAGFGVVESRTPFKLIPPEEMRRKFQEVAERKGLTLDRIADKIEQHLEARANQTLNGKEVTVSEAPDNRVQQKAIDQLTDLMGLREVAKATQAGSSITVSVTGAAADRLLQAFEQRESSE